MDVPPQRSGEPQLVEETAEKRPKTLTTAGQALYEENVNKHGRMLQRIKNKIDSEIEYFLRSDNKTNIAVLVKESLTNLAKDYKRASNEYCAFLERTYTRESESELVSHKEILAKLDSQLETCIDEIDRVVKIDRVVSQSDLPERASKSSSRRSRTSNRSDSSSTIRLKKKVEAEAAKARLEFAKKEAEMKLQKSKLEEEEQIRRAEAARKTSDLETNIHLLNAEKEKAAADAGLQAIESFVDTDSEKISLVATSDSEERTRKYVDEVRNFRAKYDTDFQDQESTVFNPEAKPFIPRPVYSQSAQPEVIGLHSSSIAQQPMTHLQTLPQLNADIAPQAPAPQVKNELSSENSHFSHLANYIMKKDLMMSRITAFDDRPEHYATWKCSFKSVCQDLNLCPTEEIDLLIRWLGPTSVNHARSIRASTIDNPLLGIKKLWSRLDERFGSPEMVEAALKKRLYNFPKLADSDSKRLYELSDLLAEIKYLKRTENYSDLLSYYDTSVGVKPIVSKLPHSLQSKWITRASKYKQHNQVPFPPFSLFCDFVNESATMMNDPGLTYEKTETSKTNSTPNRKINTKKTEFSEPPVCPIHNSTHTLNQCRTFRKKPLKERKQILRENQICYKCCESNTHVYKTCNTNVKCSECGSDRHCTAMHTTPRNQQTPNTWTPSYNGGESSTHKPKDEKSYRIHQDRDSMEPDIVNKCTAVCGDSFSGRSCAKAVLVNVHHKNDPLKSLTLYALIDDQSNCTLARSELFDHMRIPKSDTQEFTLSSCAGRQQMSGRRTAGFVVSSIDRSVTMELPVVTECNDIPDDRSEIPTPDVTNYHPHLCDLPIPPLNPEAEILLLIGRDLLEAHHIIDQRIGARNAPFAQRLNLGWVVIGNVCLGNFHRPNSITSYKTTLLQNGRETIFQPCESIFQLKHCVSVSPIHSNVFHVQHDDNEIGNSPDDREFIDIMDRGFQKDPDGRWKAPLPFKTPRQPLPNNRS